MQKAEIGDNRAAAAGTLNNITDTREESGSEKFNRVYEEVYGPQQRAPVLRTSEGYEFIPVMGDDPDRDEHVTDCASLCYCIAKRHLLIGAVGGTLGMIGIIMAIATGLGRNNTLFNVVSLIVGASVLVFSLLLCVLYACVDDQRRQALQREAEIALDEIDATRDEEEGGPNIPLNDVYLDEHNLVW